MTILIDLGCGTIHKKGYISVDIDKDCKPMIIADATMLPFKDNTVDGIFSNHFFEHITHENLLKVVDEMYRVCKHGAKIQIECPHYLSPVSCHSIHHGFMNEQTFNDFFYNDDCKKKYFKVDSWVNLMWYHPRRKGWQRFIPFFKLVPCSVFYELGVVKTHFLLKSHNVGL